MERCEPTKRCAEGGLASIDDGGGGNRTRVGGLLPTSRRRTRTLAPADAGASASNERHKQAADADNELPATHPGQVNVFDLLGDG